jgi:hypothetical protein
MRPSTTSPRTLSLKDQVKHSLDEILILITGAQILIGFQYNAVLARGFENLPIPVQHWQLIGLVLLLFALMLIMSPVPYHRIVAQSQDTQRFCHYINYVIVIALVPFALGLGLDTYIVAQKIGGNTLGLIAGLIALLLAAAFWYVIELIRRPIDRPSPMKSSQPDESPKLSDKVDHVLTEARVVLPGAQALLGFQFIGVLAEGFDKLPQTSQYLHLISLLLLTLTTILLMTPPAYHRIVEHGEDTEQFQRIAGRFVLAAMTTLALGITINFYVVVDKVIVTPGIALISALLILILFFGLWFGYTFYQRRRTPASV